MPGDLIQNKTESSKSRKTSPKGFAAFWESAVFIFRHQLTNITDLHLIISIPLAYVSSQ